MRKDDTQNNGLAAQTANPKGKTTKANFNDNSALNQRLKILDYLLEHGSISTSQAREKLDVYYPPARVSELRRDGYLIVTIWEIWISEHGIKHRIARYVLQRKEPLENLELSEVA